MVIAIMPGFNFLGHSVAPIFLLMEHFIYQFSMSSEKLTKINRLEVRIFCKMHHQILSFLALCSCVWRFQMPLEGFKFCENTSNG